MSSPAAAEISRSEPPCCSKTTCAGAVHLTHPCQLRAPPLPVAVSTGDASVFSEPTTHDPATPSPCQLPPPAATATFHRTSPPPTFGPLRGHGCTPTSCPPAPRAAAAAAAAAAARRILSTSPPGHRAAESAFGLALPAVLRKSAVLLAHHLLTSCSRSNDSARSVSLDRSPCIRAPVFPAGNPPSSPRPCAPASPPLPLSAGGVTAGGRASGVDCGWGGGTASARGGALITPSPTPPADWASSACSAATSRRPQETTRHSCTAAPSAAQASSAHLARSEPAGFLLRRGQRNHICVHLSRPPPHHAPRGETIASSTGTALRWPAVRPAVPVAQARHPFDQREKFGPVILPPSLLPSRSF